MVDITYRNKEKIEEIRKKKKRVQRVARFVSIVFALTAVGALAFVVPNIADKVENHALNDEIRSEVVYENVYTAPTQVQSENGEMTEVTQSYDDIDFETLKQINPETVGWITCEGTNINYPVVQTSDNDKYLHTSFDGQENSSGTIYLDANNNKDFSDDVTVIYGHNMNDGSMFAALNKYRDQSYLDANPVFYYHTENAVYRFDVFAAGELSGYEAEAGNYSSEEELLAKINRFEDTAITKRDVSLINDQNEISNIVILNTCTPKGSYVEDEVEKDNDRTLVYAKVTKVLDKTLQNQVSEGMHR